MYPALCTPFTNDDGVDLDAQRRVVRFAIESGAHGVVAFGLAGEVLKLRAVERKAITDVIVEEVDGRVPVFAGVGAESLGVARELARYAEGAGVSCIVLPAPISGAVGEAALVDYFARIASEVSIPVMIQDAPAYLGVTVGPALVERAAAAAENIRLVKLEAGPAEMSRWFSRLGDGFSVWGGDGGIYLLDCIRIGATGIIPGVDLIDLLVEVYDTEADDPQRAEELFRKILPTLVFEIQHSIDHFNACAKHVLKRRGVLTSARLRAPAAHFDDVSVALLERHLAALDLADGAVRVSD
jgi:2-keto-3-deoxy-L-arabinonate dehydratase